MSHILDIHIHFFSSCASLVWFRKYILKIQNCVSTNYRSCFWSLVGLRTIRLMIRRSSRLLHFSNLSLWWSTSYTDGAKAVLWRASGNVLSRAVIHLLHLTLPHTAVGVEIAIFGHRWRFSPALTRYVRGIFTLAANCEWVTAFLE